MHLNARKDHILASSGWASGQGGVHKKATS